MSGSLSANKCWPEPPAITVNNNTFVFGENEEARFVKDVFKPAAGVGFLTLSYTPVTGGLLGFKNGVELDDASATPDLTRSGKNITLTTATHADDKFIFWYLTTDPV